MKKLLLVFSIAVFTLSCYNEEIKENKIETVEEFQARADALMSEYLSTHRAEGGSVQMCSGYDYDVYYTYSNGNYVYSIYTYCDGISCSPEGTDISIVNVFEAHSKCNQQ